MKKLKASIFLTLFLMSTFGNAVEFHFCDGKLTDISFLQSAQCKHEEEAPNAHTCCETEMVHTHDSCHEDLGDHLDISNEKHEGCCESERMQAEGWNAIPSGNVSVATLAVFYVCTDFCFFYPLTDTEATVQVPYEERIPNPDLQVLFQTFLI